MPIILNTSESEFESDEDAGNDDAGNNDLICDGSNNPESVEEEGGDDPNSANDCNGDYSLKKAKEILWRLKQRDLLDLIDEVDSTETEKVLLDSYYQNTLLF